MESLFANKATPYVAELAFALVEPSFAGEAVVVKRLTTSLDDFARLGARRVPNSRAGIASASSSPFEMGAATKVDDMIASLRADGTLPSDFSLRFMSRNYMKVRDAAGHGGDVQSLGTLRSVFWEPGNVGQRLIIEQLPNGTIPINVDGRLIRNPDLLRRVIRHEVGEVQYLKPFSGQTMSSQSALNLQNAGHRAGIAAE